MPSYSFYHVDCPDHIWTQEMTVAEREEYLASNTSVAQTLATPGFAHSERMGMVKPADGFRDRLKEIKKAHLHSTVNTW